MRRFDVRRLSASAYCVSRTAVQFRGVRLEKASLLRDNAFALPQPQKVSSALLA